ncbi:hypothetical protein OK016_24780 [Vibrio chagasii]|nr:hypothetical protein [Vibrio chagasii]
MPPITLSLIADHFWCSLACVKSIISIPAVDVSDHNKKKARVNHKALFAYTQ